MTPKEAIELIEYELPFTSGVVEDALNILRTCADKQTPKKVILGYDEQDYIRCPQCKSEIAPMDDDCLLYHCPNCGEKDAILQGDNYCFNCGQALDWSDEDDR